MIGPKKCFNVNEYFTNNFKLNYVCMHLEEPRSTIYTYCEPSCCDPVTGLPRATSLLVRADAGSRPAYMVQEGEAGGGIPSKMGLHVSEKENRNDNEVWF